MRDLLMRELGDLRYEPTDKRIRATLGDRTVIDTTRALLVWEPKRIIPFSVHTTEGEPLVIADGGREAGAFRPADGALADHVSVDFGAFCGYKGQASYWSLDGDDVAWTYVEPLREAAEVTGRIAFFNERVDVVVDGERMERPATPWSR